jgi:hypothetical protein
MGKNRGRQKKREESLRGMSAFLLSCVPGFLILHRTSLNLRSSPPIRVIRAIRGRLNSWSLNLRKEKSFMSARPAFDERKDNFTPLVALG